MMAAELNGENICSNLVHSSGDITNDTVTLSSIIIINK